MKLKKLNRQLRGRSERHLNAICVNTYTNDNLKSSVEMNARKSSGSENQCKWSCNLFPSVHDVFMSSWMLSQRSIRFTIKSATTYIRTHYNKVYKSVQNTFREIFMARTIHQTNRTSFSRILRSFAVCTG